MQGCYPVSAGAFAGVESIAVVKKIFLDLVGLMA